MFTPGIGPATVGASGFELLAASQPVSAIATAHPPATANHLFNMKAPGSTRVPRNGRPDAPLRNSVYRTNRKICLEQAQGWVRRVIVGGEAYGTMRAAWPPSGFRF